MPMTSIRTPGKELLPKLMMSSLLAISIIAFLLGLLATSVFALPSYFAFFACLISTISAAPFSYLAAREIVKLKRLGYDVSILANYDDLTGALSRRAMVDVIKRAVSNGGKQSLAYLDVDHFKAINDTYGHLVGDEILKEIASAIRSNIIGDDRLGRIGGEEFAVLFANKSLEDAESVCAAISQRVNEIKHPLLDRKVTISIGIADLRQDEDLDSLLKRADDRLYAAKRQGRDMIISRDPLAA